MKEDQYRPIFRHFFQADWLRHSTDRSKVFSNRQHSGQSSKCATKWVGIESVPTWSPGGCYKHCAMCRGYCVFSEVVRQSDGHEGWSGDSHPGPTTQCRLCFKLGDKYRQCCGTVTIYLRFRFRLLTSYGSCPGSTKPLFSGSILYWTGTRSADPWLGLMDTDPPICVIHLQDANKKLFKNVFFWLLFVEGTLTKFF